MDDFDSSAYLYNALNWSSEFTQKINFYPFCCNKIYTLIA